MFSFLTELLSDKKGGITFNCFDVWHLFYILIFAVVFVVLCLFLRNKSEEKRRKAINAFSYTAFGLYIADFFLMPFAYGEIDIEKLPFHICTAMCVMCFLSCKTAFFGKYKLQFALLGFLSNLVYLIYPAGVMWHSVHPLSYRVVQTLAFHGIMAVYGALVLVYEARGFAWKRCYRDIAVLAAMTAWAVVGNFMYNSEGRIYNWFFVVQDPFGLFNKDISPFIMPFLNVIIFFCAEMLVYAFLYTAVWKRNHQKAVV